MNLRDQLKAEWGREITKICEKFLNSETTELQYTTMQSKVQGTMVYFPVV